MPEATSPAAEEEATGRRLGLLFYTFLTAALAVAASVVSLAFQLWPSLKPDPRTTLGADVKIFAVDRNVTFDQYLHRTTFSRKQYAAAKRRAEREAESVLAIHGEIVYVETTIQGFKRRSIVLRRALYNGRTRTLVPLPNLSGAAAAEIHLEAPTDQSVEPIWLPGPPGLGRYFVRVELVTRSGAILAVADSPSFRGF